MAAETFAKVTDSAVEYIAKEDAVDKNTANDNQPVGENTDGTDDKVRARDAIIFTIGILLLCMLFVVIGYLFGELIVFLEKNGDISGFFKAA